MSNESDSNTEQNEEVVDLFASGTDDNALLAEGRDEDPAQSTDAQAPASKDESPSDEEDNLPAKYRGKSITDVIEMHQNLEKAYGRHNNELGDLRQLTDTILKQQLGEDAGAKTSKIDSDALLEDPEATLTGAIEANPKIAKLEAKLEARERADNLQAFNRAHPDAETVVGDPRFAAWVQASPTRMRLYQQADATYDYELAGELLDTYKSLNPAEATDGKANEAATGLTNAKPSGGRKTKKARIFKRSDIMRLRVEDPDRYEKLQPEIMKAYAENRVR